MEFLGAQMIQKHDCFSCEWYVLLRKTDRLNFVMWVSAGLEPGTHFMINKIMCSHCKPQNKKYL